MPTRTVRAVLLVSAFAAGLAPSDARQLAARPTDEWIKLLDSPARVATLKVDEVVSKLQLTPGSVVADLGAGSGVFTVPLARAVGPSGKVYAVEVDQGLVDYVGQKAKKENLANVRTVLGKFEDPGLPAPDVGVAFMHDVLHHVADRAGYLKNVARYLTPAGRIAIVEPDAVKGPHRDDPKLQVTRAELNGWMADAGFVPSEEFTLFEDKWYVVYKRK